MFTREELRRVWFASPVSPVRRQRAAWLMLSSTYRSTAAWDGRLLHLQTHITPPPNGGRESKGERGRRKGGGSDTDGIRYSVSRREQSAERERMKWRERESVQEMAVVLQGEGFVDWLPLCSHADRRRVLPRSVNSRGGNPTPLPVAASPPPKNRGYLPQWIWGVVLRISHVKTSLDDMRKCK